MLKNNRIKIGDLGSVKNLNESVVRSSSNVGTPLYMSPEMIQFKENKMINITTKTDIWSIGVVIYELLTLKRLFNQTKQNELKKEILKFDVDKDLIINIDQLSVNLFKK